jgi:uncharacterized protein YndB with AHSA1/START domain
MAAATQEPGIRSSVDAEKGIITVVTDIAASPERVFHALTDDPPRVLEFTWSPSWDGFAVRRLA